jgi:hypothetical protein
MIPWKGCGVVADDAGDVGYDLSWFVAQRWQQYDGEQRANYLRILAVGAFYVMHLLNYFRPFDVFELSTQPGKSFHQAVTVLAVAWILLGLAVDMCLRQRFFPPSLPFITTACDLTFLTSVLCLGNGQQSPLVAGYFLIIILAALRVSLWLIRGATFGAAFGYLFVLTTDKWPQLFGVTTTGRVPRYSQAMTLLAITISGMMLGQLIRRVRHVAETFAISLKSQTRHSQP